MNQMTNQGPIESNEAAKRAAYGEELRGWLSDWTSSWRDALKPTHMGSDLMAGVTVAAVALPLNLALAVASGVPPSAGLIAGAIGGGLAAILGGAPLQVTGPAAALNVMVLAIATTHGAAGVAAAALLVGLIQLVLAFSMAGKLAKYVPETVLAGFTTGVGLKLLDSQIPEFLGFDYKVAELAQMMHRPIWLREVSWLSVVSGLLVAFLVISTKQYKRFPAALVGVALVTALSLYLGWDIERVGAVPSSLPSPTLPLLSGAQWGSLLAQTLPLGLLAAAESLLSAQAVDRMAPAMRRHNPNLEVFGQGMANLASGLFSGMPVSGVVVRSGVNVQSGGRTRRSALLHAVALLVSVLVLSATISEIPLAALAGLLLVIAFRLIELDTLVHLVKTERVGALAFLTTAIGTVTGHLVMGLGVGLLIHFVGARFGKRHPEGGNAGMVTSAES